MLKSNSFVEMDLPKLDCVSRRQSLAPMEQPANRKSLQLTLKPINLVAPKAPEEKVEVECSDYYFECTDAIPSTYINQKANKQVNEEVKLGKRKHRESYLSEGPAVQNKREMKRFRKAKKMPAPKTGNSLLDFLNTLGDYQPSMNMCFSNEPHIPAALART